LAQKVAQMSEEMKKHDAANEKKLIQLKVTHDRR
jgi:hypothetical protein